MGVRLTTILAVIFSSQAAAGIYGQGKVTLHVKNAALVSVLKDIRRQTGYLYSILDEYNEKAQKVSVTVDDASVEEALNLVFKDQPLTYTIIEKTIVVKQKEVPKQVDENKLLGLGAFFTARGLVKNEAGQPLSGAYISIKETGKGSITNAKGEFQLLRVSVKTTLIISYIGYESKSIVILNDGWLEVQLAPAKNELDKVVVQAYGTTSQRFTTGDIATVTAEEIEKQPVMNPLMALQGRVAGLDIQQTSGYASAPIKAQIRGETSVDGNTVYEPLYIVDEVPLSVLNIGKAQNAGTGSYGFLQNAGLIGPANGQSPLFSINPADIESITVLKDADATSIYGSRGANGVILITTKKGKVGKPRLDIHVDEGVNKVSRYWKMLNTPQYLNMRREAFKNDGITPDAGSAPDLLVWDTTRFTDWQKAIYGRAGRVVNAQISLTGGDARTTFRLGANYTHSTEITTANGADQQAAVSFNMTYRSLDQRISLSLSNAFSFSQSDMIQLPGTVSFAPDAPSVFDSTGRQLNWTQWNAAAGPGANLFGVLLQPYTAKTSFLNSNLVFSYQPVRGLSFKTSLGYNSGQADQVSLTPIASQDPANQPTGTSQYGNNNNKNWIIEPQISYDLPIGTGKMNFLAGGSEQQTTTAGNYFGGQGYTSDFLLRAVSAAPTKFAYNNLGEYRYASVFARVSYNLSNKYIVDVNARRDGSSNYGPGNQFGNFASVGAAWIFTEEGWFKHHFSFLSFGKLRGSYGTAGSDGGKPYGYLTRWTADNLITYNGIQSLIATQHANPDYHWQQNRKLEAGVDMGFFKDLITIRASYYRNRTNNQLLAYPTPMLSGFSSVISNLPALVQNAGYEFTIGGKGVHSKYFSWAPAINFSINQNKFLSFPGLGSSPYRNQGKIGQPLNGLYLLHYTGVDPQTGQYTYQDRNHDGMINPNYGPTGDVYFKKISPSFSTGFGFNFDLKGLNLAIFFSVKKQTGVNAIAEGVDPGYFSIGRANQPVDVLARWENPGDISSVGKYSTIRGQDPNGFLSRSDIGFTDASYIRIQNLSCSYALPESYTKKAGMKSCSLFIHANNILTITSYKGIDPDIQNFGGLPPTRTIVGGVSINF